MEETLYIDKRKIRGVFEKMCFGYCITTFLIAFLAFFGWTIPVWIQAVEFSMFLVASFLTVHCGFCRILNAIMVLCGILLIAIF